MLIVSAFWATVSLAPVFRVLTTIFWWLMVAMAVVNIFTVIISGRHNIFSKIYAIALAGFAQFFTLYITRFYFNALNVLSDSIGRGQGFLDRVFVALDYVFLLVFGGLLWLLCAAIFSYAGFILGGDEHENPVLISTFIVVGMVAIGSVLGFFESLPLLGNFALL